MDLAALISHPNAQLERDDHQCQTQIDMHTVDLAEYAVEAVILPRIRKNAATCIRQIAKQTTELAKLIVHSGGAVATADYISESKGHMRPPSLMILFCSGSYLKICNISGKS